MSSNFIQLILRYCRLFTLLMRVNKTSGLTLHPKHTCSILVRALISRERKEKKSPVLLTTYGHFSQLVRALFSLKAYWMRISS